MENYIVCIFGKTYDMKQKTQQQQITAYMITWDKEYAKEELGGQINTIAYLDKRELNGLKKSKRWKKVITLSKITETTIITKIKIW